MELKDVLVYIVQLGGVEVGGGRDGDGEDEDEGVKAMVALSLCSPEMICLRLILQPESTTSCDEVAAWDLLNGETQCWAVLVPRCC
jgi:hypothetical protein